MHLRVLLPVLAALLAPGSAAAGLTSLEVRELPLHGERTLSATSPKAPFQLVGIHWRGTGSLDVRTRSQTGAWSRWAHVVDGDRDGPDAGSAEARRVKGWRKSVPVWVGQAVAVEVRTSGRVIRARALTVRSPVSKVPLRVTTSPGVPRLVPRSGWLADESIRRGKPAYADTLRMAHVHHTAGTNTYTRLEAPAVVRAIQTYHVKGNGWNDIGYNALVDRFGTLYEGRFGGIDRNVVGAHARGFNTESFGIAVMGDFRTTAPPAAAVDTVVGALAWRLDLAHVDPLATFTAISPGNERFNKGVPVFLRAVSGHRDTGLTTCPGERLYALIPEIARRAAALGLPKIYAPEARADESGGTRFTARVSSRLAWSVVVTDAAGVELGRGDGIGTQVDWTWQPSAPVPAGTTWRIEVPGATAAAGALAPAATGGALALTGAKATPETISPNGDGQADTATVTFTLTADANVDVSVVDTAGVTVAEVEPRRWRRAGPRTVVFDGAGLSDGIYTLRVRARATGGREASTDIPVGITRTLGKVLLDADALTPNGDGRGDQLTVTVPLAAAATVTVTILREGRWVATPFSGALEPGEQVVTWDGKKRLGKARDGTHVVSIQAVDAVGTTRVDLPFLLDATAPVVRVVSAAPPRLWVSEAATLTLRANGARRILRVEGPGVVRIPRIERLRTLVAYARDAAGNETTFRR